MSTKTKTSALAAGLSNIYVQGARPRTSQQCRSLSTTKTKEYWSEQQSLFWKAQDYLQEI